MLLGISSFAALPQQKLVRRQLEVRGQLLKQDNNNL
jgi:hypothetical protein